MLKLPLDRAAYFQQSFELSPNYRIQITFRFNSIATDWMIDVFDYHLQRFVAQGVALVVGVPLLWRHPIDYCFLLNDLSGLDIDPFSVNDLANRFEFYVLMKNELKA